MNPESRLTRQAPVTSIPPVLILMLLILGVDMARAQPATGLRGNPDAISDARAMVETMGGLDVWARLQSVHFVHDWDIATRADRYLENEILDLTASRSYVTMESETYHRIRAYSPEHRYWNIVNGEFAYTNDAAFENAMERAPYNIYRLARAIALDDNRIEVRFGENPFAPEVPALEFVGPDGNPHGWIALNMRKEPILWATTQYMYTFGPLQRFGNLYVPDWATANSGVVRYEMVSLKGSVNPPDLSLFAVPTEYR